MTITIELTVEQETRLASEANKRGVKPEEFASELLSHSLTSLPQTPQELYAFWEKEGVFGLWADCPEDSPELARKWRREANAS